MLLRRPPSFNLVSGGVFSALHPAFLRPACLTSIYHIIYVFATGYVLNPNKKYAPCPTFPFFSTWLKYANFPLLYFFSIQLYSLHICFHIPRLWLKNTHIIIDKTLKKIEFNICIECNY